MYVIIICDPDVMGKDSVVDAVGPFESWDAAEEWAKANVDGEYCIPRMGTR